MITIIQSSNRRAVEALLSPERARDRATEHRVARIVSDVRRDGDRALLRYARTLDALRGPAEVSLDEMHDRAATVPKDVRAAIRAAARHIRKVARRQVPRGWRVQLAPGVSVEQRVVPLDRVGCYVPGGRYPLPSSLLMTAIPATAAGVREVVAVCPRPEPVVMAAALEAGVSRLFRIGGAHAVAALAYGTASVPRVDKIVGPGNRYVAAAKALVARDCGIDFYAGPTEIVIVASRGRAEWIAADLIAQAEHDPDARAVLITPNRMLASRVATEVAKRMPATGPARESLRAHGGIVVTRSVAEAIALANAAAPEHLVVDDDGVAARIRCAGSLFVGGWSAQVAGDYAIGSNHVLPTSGAARVRGGLSAADFVRQITVQRVTRAGLARIGPSVINLARAEGLTGHAESIVVRVERSAGLKNKTRPTRRKNKARPTQRENKTRPTRSTRGS
jgi:histidinol dehydrogenase